MTESKLIETLTTLRNSYADLSQSEAIAEHHDRSTLYAAVASAYDNALDLVNEYLIVRDYLKACE